MGASDDKDVKKLFAEIRASGTVPRDGQTMIDFVREYVAANSIKRETDMPTDAVCFEVSKALTRDNRGQA